jgi:ligand-binding sensor domain-containing protein
MTAVFSVCAVIFFLSIVCARKPQRPETVSGHRILKTYGPIFEEQGTRFSISIPNAIYQDTAGLYWFGHMFGLFAYDERANRWTVARDHQGQELSLWRGDICQDRKGRIWFLAGPEGSAMFLEGGMWQSGLQLGPQQLRGVKSMFPGRDGRIWIASKDGLTAYDGQRWADTIKIPAGIYTRHNALKPRRANDQLSARMSNDKTRMGPNADKEYSKTNRTAATDDIGILSGVEDGSRVWLATDRAILTYTEASARWQLQPLPTQLIEGHILAVDRGNRVWVADTCGNVAAFDRRSASWKSFNLSQVVSREITKPLSILFIINAIYQDRAGQMMFATDHGLFVFDEQKNKWQVYSYYGGSFSLSNLTLNPASNIDEVPRHIITSVKEDRIGRIWIGTEEGIVVLSP